MLGWSCAGRLGYDICMTNDAGVIASVQVGLPQHFGTQGAADPMDRPWVSGYVKRSVGEPVWVSRTGIRGDGQADLKHHGGPEKAVLAYAASHYARWREELGITEFGAGALGENLTVQGMSEESVCIGDTYRAGEVLMQVSQPRQPCWKISRRWRVKDLALRAQESGRTGWYLRVLHEGWLQTGTKLELVDRPMPEWSVARASRLLHVEKQDRKNAAVLAACELLAPSWRETFAKRAESGVNPRAHNRLVGPNEG